MGAYYRPPSPPPASLAAPRLSPPGWVRSVARAFAYDGLSKLADSHTVVGDNIGKSLTIQHGVPDLTGTVRPFTFKGCKLSGAEFSCKVDELLTMSLDIDGRQASEVETLVAASLATGVAPFHWAQMSVKLGAFGAEAAVSGVKGFSVKFDRGMASERFYAGAGGLKAEPIMNDFLKVSGSIEVDLVNKADFADRFAATCAQRACECRRRSAGVEFSRVARHGRRIPRDRR